MGYKYRCHSSTLVRGEYFNFLPYCLVFFTVVNNVKLLTCQQRHSMTPLCGWPGHHYSSYELLPSGRRYAVLPLQTSCAQRSFTPSSKSPLNKAMLYEVCSILNCCVFFLCVFCLYCLTISKRTIN